MYEVDVVREYLKNNRITPKRVLQLSLGVLFIIIMLSSSFSAIAYRTETSKAVEKQSKQVIFSYELDERIGIFYHASDLVIAGTAVSLYNSLRLIYKSIDLIPVGSIDEIKAVNDPRYNILIYVFDTTLEGVMIGEQVDWENFASYLKSYPQQQHILGMGNANQLYEYIPPKYIHNVWIEGSDILDAQLAYLWCVWSVADILEAGYEQYSDYYNAGINIRKLSIKYFSENINSIVERSFDTVNPMGEEDLAAKQQRFEDMKERFPKELEPKFTLDELRELPEENKPAMYIKKSTEEALGLGDLIIGFLPLESGLQGPIGGILDLLLEIFLDKVGDEISISESAMEQIETAFQLIEAMLGFFSGDMDAESGLSALFDIIRELIPFPEEMVPYIQLIFDAIPLLRGDFSAISDIITRLMDLLIPEDVMSSLGYFKTIITEVLDLSIGVIDELHSDGGNFLDALLSVMSDRYLTSLVEKFCKDTLGLSVSEITGYVEKITLFLKGAMDFLARFDVKNLVNEYLPQLLELVIGAIDSSLAEEYSSKIGVIIKLIMSGIKFIDLPLADILNEVMSIFDLGITAEQVNALIQKINILISQAKETAASSVTDFKAGLISGIDELKGQLSFTIDSNIQSMIVTASTMVAGAINGDFTDKNNLPTLNETLDLVLGIVGGGSGAALSLPDSNTIKGIINTIVSLIAVITDKDEMKQYVASTVDSFKSMFSDPAKLIDGAIKLLFSGSSFDFNSTIMTKIRTFSEMGMALYRIIMAAKENSIQGILQALIQNVGLSLVKEIGGVDIDFVKDILEFIFPKFFGTETSELPSAQELVTELKDTLESLLDDSMVASVGIPGITTVTDLKDAIGTVLEIVFNAKDIFNDGLRWLFGQLMDWIGGQIEILINMLLEAITSALDDSDLLPPEWSGSLPVALGGLSLFEIGIELGLYPHFGFDVDAFTDWMLDIVFGGLNPFEGDIGAFFGKIFSFFELIPTFKAGFELGGFGTEDNPLMAFLLESLGLELEFSGKGWFELELFTLKGGVFDTDNFFKVIEWGFSFTITVSRTFTLLDFLTGGTAGALNAVGEYLGLDAITVTVSFGIFVEVVKRAASATGPEEGSFTLKITLGLAVHFGIDLFIVGISFDFSMEIILTFFQDLVNPVPLKIFLEIILRFSVTLTFLFADWEIEFTWKPLDPSPYELTPTDPAEQKAEGAMGLDADQDGISDKDEEATPGLNPNNPDTDGDGLTDKFETQTSKTDPILPDTDSDGLDDFVEYHNTKTNPRQPDTDWDGLTDYEEAIIIGTNPLDTDTDEDGIDDYYEVNHAYDILRVTPTVEFVMIGGVKYFDRTDPLNPDTDGDGLIDGEEGEFGPYYGLPDLYNETAEAGTDTPPLIFNGGYTHPLDDDTDDDTFEQLYDGSIAPSHARAYVKIADGSWILTTDYWEVKGMPIIYMIEGEPVLNVTYTNPVNPDTDGDTGIMGYDRTGAPDLEHANPPISEILNSDGYELSLDPPSDPCDADTDNDGLIDGLEGTRGSQSNHTHYAVADTDGDGLGDLQEILLGSNPLHPDGDHDMVNDGDEYFKYGTNPANPDTDFDGLLDGEELYWYHCNPFSVDSDGDRIGDWMELMVYFTDPMDEDTDNDRLNDYEEVFIYRTKPNDYDTDSEEWNDLNGNGRYDGLDEWDIALDENGNGVWDGDYLRDGDEVYGTYNGIKTDPLKWDTDLDSITYFVVYEERGGQIDYTFRLSDGDELYYYGTNPTYGDSDLDGITDGWELYLASGLIPSVVFDYYQIPFPVALDPLSNDTDGDSLLDGLELMIGNSSSLIYPYVGFFFTRPYNTSPVLADSDFDFLNDSEEIDVYFTRPDNMDTDNDTLSDYDELFFHLTDPLKSDTDADGLMDCDETTAVVPAPIEYKGNIKFKITLMGPYFPVYPTNATDPDTDNDLLPDGAELDVNMNYHSDPMDADSLVNGTLDGMLFDSDHDGIPDGFEYFGDSSVNGTLTATTGIAGGGPFNPDSDSDGLLDGLEWQIQGTDPANWDTDNDTWGDGLEVLVGTDPLTFTNITMMYQALDQYRDDLVITSPIETSYETEVLTITTTNLTTFVAIQYRFSEGPVSSELTDMTYNHRQYQYESNLLTLSKGSYLLEVVGTRPSGTEVVKRIRFYIQMTPLDIPALMIGGIFGFGITSLILMMFNRLNFQKLFGHKKEGGL
ncbi:MAG: hypothetical protein ACXAAT_03655 [Candidatus Hodarchaeales archaeon]|jgi:hypothetical protein